MRCTVLGLVALGLGVVCQSAGAQTIGPAFTGLYSLQDLGAVPGVATKYGGLTFLSGDSNTLLIGGAANGPGGRVYRTTVTRDANGHVTGFGQATDYCQGNNNDGGMAYAPNGTLFVSVYPGNEINQILPGQTVAARVSNLSSIGVASSIGGLTWVPTRQPGAGRLKVASYSGGGWYDVLFTPQGDGTYTLDSSSLRAQINGGPEGIVYVPTCARGFGEPSVLVCEFGTGSVATYAVNALGDPVVSTRRVFVSGLSGAEGCVIDPVTGDFLFCTYGGGNHVVRVIGFPPPAHCPCDWNNVGCLNSQDFFDFLSDFFQAHADFNLDGQTNSQDFFDFLACFFGGCPN